MRKDSSDPARWSAVLNGRRITAGSGERVSFPRGSAHRWWNDGNEALVFEGYVQPVADLDRFIQALFEVVNAGPDGRPPLFYMAHALLRHRHTQTTLNDAAADSSRAVSSDRRHWHSAWALPRRWLARVPLSLCRCAVRCQRSHLMRPSKAMLVSRARGSTEQ